MKLGLLGAAAGLGGAVSNIGDMAMQDRAMQERFGMQEQMRIAAEDRAETRADAQEQRKMDFAQQQAQQHRGLLAGALAEMPEGASDVDRARVLTEHGLLDEGKQYLEIGKAQDQSEYRSAMLDAQNEKRLATIEAARARLEASSANRSRDLSFQEYQGMSPDQKAMYDQFKGRNQGGQGATSLQKDVQWMMDQGLADSASTAFDRLRSDPSENTVRQLTTQILSDPRNFKMSPADARRQALDIIAAEQVGSSSLATSVQPNLDLNRFFK